MGKNFGVQPLNTQKPLGSSPSPSRFRIPWWQRQYLVNRDLQLRFARSGVVIGVVSTMVCGGMILWSFRAFNIWQGQRLPLPILIVILIVLIINVTAIYIAGVLATQKIAGPLFNLMKQLQKVRSGDFTSFARFRDSDEIHYVARRFNQMVDGLAERERWFLEKSSKAHTCIKEGDYETAQQILNEMSAKHGISTGDTKAS